MTKDNKGAEAGVIIFNLNRLPFRDFDSAAQMRDILMAESGHQYRIDKYGDDDDQDYDVKSSEGFVIRRSPSTGSDKEEEGVGSSEENSINVIYHPALRTYLVSMPALLACILLFLFPLDILSIIFSSFDIDELPEWINIGLLIKMTRGCSAAFFLFNIIGVLYSYFGVSLIIDNKGVSLKKGIIAQDIIGVRFSEIRTTGLKRGVLDRLLNVGTLELSSSGSDGVDIRFYNLSNPLKIKDDIDQKVNEVMRVSRRK